MFITKWEKWPVLRWIESDENWECAESQRFQFNFCWLAFRTILWRQITLSLSLSWNKSCVSVPTRSHRIQSSATEKVRARVRTLYGQKFGFSIRQAWLVEMLNGRLIAQTGALLSSSSRVGSVKPRGMNSPGIEHSLQNAYHMKLLKSAKFVKDLSQSRRFYRQT